MASKHKQKVLFPQLNPTEWKGEHELFTSNDDRPDNHCCSNSYCLFLPKRYCIAFLTMLAFLLSYGVRAGISIAVVAMVSSRETTINGTITVKDPEFRWSTKTQGVILGSFFGGYMLTQVPGGVLAQRFGGRVVLGLCMLFSSIFVFLSPVAARTHVALLVAASAAVGSCKYIRSLDPQIDFLCTNASFGIRTTRVLVAMVTRIVLLHALTTLLASRLVISAYLGKVDHVRELADGSGSGDLGKDDHVRELADDGGSGDLGKDDHVRELADSGGSGDLGKDDHVRELLDGGGSGDLGKDDHARELADDGGSGDLGKDDHVRELADSGGSGDLGKDDHVRELPDGGGSGDLGKDDHVGELADDGGSGDLGKDDHVRELADSGGSGDLGKDDHVRKLYNH
ncbi:predicted protein [Nematostella vectensis]|uniref:Major facilitator superfamily (MFS) profile domain-containing protein n=1 Tax=Nematostella vectensis TaxID=45351 RepID=A7SQE5_NEMVE|nr:predicted protein [Nematostella vectensis]|eukprot:XP_001626148.1 predicted protein [Nematostella vectensis]